MLKKIMVIAALITFVACSQEDQNTLSKLESRYGELTELNNNLEDKRNEFYGMVREYNKTQSESQQFDIASFDTLMGKPESDLLKEMFRNEDDISYSGLLKKIIAKNEEIISLNDEISNLQTKILALEEKLPKAYIVKSGDTHYQIIRDILINNYAMDKKQAHQIAWKTSMTDNILPGNQIWFSYDKDNSIVQTFVTQGTAKIAPMSFEQIAKRNMIKKAIENAQIGTQDSGKSKLITQLQ